jgi:hypothetical protein
MGGGSGIPDHLTLDVDANLSGGLSINAGTVGVDIKEIPKLSIGIDPLDIAIKPLEVWFGLKEVPRIRVHLPAYFSVCLSLFGREFMALKLCGEGQVITEPYVAGLCEEECEPNKNRLRPVLKLRTDE